MRSGERHFFGGPGFSLATQRRTEVLRHLSPLWVLGACVAQGVSLAVAAVALLVSIASAIASAQQPPARGQGASPARSARASAPIDLTGNWVAVITEDWRWRMMTPAKGDYASLPLTSDARRVADLWDPAKDEASGNACKPFGVGNIMRMPGRLRISWQGENTLKLEFDAGTQTRLLNFTTGAAGEKKTTGEKTWQGQSVASWETAGQDSLDRNGLPTAPAGRGGAAAAASARGGSLKVVTTGMREGHLRKNGVPYSADAVVTEYFDRVGPEPNGDIFLIVRTTVEDSKYLSQPFITSSNFKLEADGSKWNPTPCKIDPPNVPGQ